MSARRALTSRVHDRVCARHEEAQQPSATRIVSRRLAPRPSALTHLSFFFFREQQQLGARPYGFLSQGTQAVILFAVRSQILFSWELLRRHRGGMPANARQRSGSTKNWPPSCSSLTVPVEFTAWEDCTESVPVVKHPTMTKIFYQRGVVFGATHS